MVIKQKILGVLIGIVFLSGMYAQKEDSYYAYLNKKVKKVLDDRCVPVSADTLKCVFEGDTFRVYRQYLGDSIYRWGMYFLPRNKQMLNTFLRNYLERQLLHYAVLSPQEWNKHLKIKQMQWHVIPEGLHTVRYLADSLHQIGMQFDKNRFSFTFASRDTGKRWEVSFPSVFGLLVGVDRPEAQKILWEKLQKASRDTTPAMLTFHPLPSERRVKENDLYIQRGGQFIIPEMNGNIYYDRNNKNLVFDTLHLAPSFSNLFLTDLAGRHPRTVEVNMRIYGKNYKAELPLDKFLNFFQKDFTKFFGYEKITDKSVDGTLVAVHNELGYVHLMHIQSEVNNLFTDGGKIYISFYGYVPLHNVASLLDETFWEKYSNNKQNPSE